MKVLLYGVKAAQPSHPLQAWQPLQLKEIRLANRSFEEEIPSKHTPPAAREEISQTQLLGNLYDRNSLSIGTRCQHVSDSEGFNHPSERNLSEDHRMILKFVQERHCSDRNGGPQSRRALRKKSRGSPSSYIRYESSRGHHRICFTPLCPRLITIQFRVKSQKMPKLQLWFFFAAKQYYDQATARHGAKLLVAEAIPTIPFIHFVKGESQPPTGWPMRISHTGSQIHPKFCFKKF